ncbi:MAG: hypothetical protein HQL75_15375, partial [Magnetococcales bacterium]|nr:hypothetical protein [Magnetococcales bacterium]
SHQILVLWQGKVVEAGLTAGDTIEECLNHAEDLLETMVSSYIEKGLALPKASPAKDRPLVHLSPMTSAKAGLYMAVNESGISKAELGRRLRWHPPQVVRVMDPRHKSTMEQIDKALAAIGKRLVVFVQDAA